MSFLFNKKKSPQELAKSLKKSIEIISDSKQQDPKEKTKALTKITENLSQAKIYFYGDADQEPKEDTIAKLADELLGSTLLLEILQHMKKFEFEARKDVASIYNFLLRQRKQESLHYFKQHNNIFTLLVEGYNDPDIALCCGSILREVVRHEEMNEVLLYTSALFDQFFEFVQLNTFDVASDAFATFKLMLTKHKQQCAKFLETNFESFFKKYNLLLQSHNYVTKRQSLKLLGELLLARTNFNVMMRYINDVDHLKIMMNLLRGNTKAIQFEAFHVFKIFVANPRKSAGVSDVLSRNKVKLIEFLQKFQKEKDDDQFAEEKNILIQTLQALETPAGSASTDEHKAQ